MSVYKISKLLKKIITVTKFFFLNGLSFVIQCAEKFFYFIGFVLISPIAILIVVIQPLIHIRFGVLDGTRIGHFCTIPEAFACLKTKNSESSSFFDIFTIAKPVCNTHLKLMWKRVFNIFPSFSLGRLIAKSVHFWSGSDRHHIDLGGYKGYDLFLKTSPHLKFTENEVKRGIELLKRLGLKTGYSWICIHNRDNKYLTQSQPGQKWNYHDYRDFSIKTMMQSAEEFTSRGYYVVRLGSIQKEKLLTNNSMIIDYSSSPYRSDFGDLFLSAGCTAYFGSDSGIHSPAMIFRKPLSFVNYTITQAHYIPKMGCITLPFITKHLYHVIKKRYISLREIFEMNLFGASLSSQFADVGVKVIENSPEEIQDLAIEVDERLKGTWQPHLEDKKLHQLFWEPFRRFGNIKIENSNVALIGSAFLRKNQYLFE